MKLFVCFSFLLATHFVSAQIDTVKKNEFPVELFIQAESQTVFEGAFLGDESYYCYETGVVLPLHQDIILKRKYCLESVLAYKNFSVYMNSLSERYSADYFDFGIRFSLHFLEQPSWSLALMNESMLNVPLRISGEDVGAYRVQRKYIIFQNKIGLGAFFNINNWFSVGLNSKLAYGTYFSSGIVPRPSSGSGSYTVLELWDRGLSFYLGLSLNLKF
jgi:hypothetical protein